MARFAAGDPAGADALLGQAVEHIETTLGREHPSLVTALYTHAALTQRGAGSFTGHMHERALAIADKTMAADHPVRAWIHMALGNVCADGRQRDEAVKHHERALELFTRAYGPHNSNLVTVLGSLAAVHQWDRADKAEELYRRALEIAERSSGPDDPALIPSLSNLGLALKVQKRFEEAKEFFERALAVTEKAFGEKDWRIGERLQDLGDLHDDMERPEEAERLYRRAVEVWEAGLGANHPAVSNGLTVLADFLESEARDEEAADLRARAGRLREEFDRMTPFDR
jgi:tetratricopeptide (TPR) repeat protein